MDNIEEIKTLIETNYNLSVEGIVTITSKSFKVSTSQHEYLLKMVNDDNDEFIMKQLFAYKTMPKNVLPIYRTTERQHIIAYQDHYFYLTDYVRMIPVPLEKQVHYYVELLSILHEKSRLMIDISDDEITKIYNKEYKKLENSYKHLQKKIEACELKKDRSPYEWYFMMVYPMIYRMLQISHEELKKFYDLIKKDHKIPISLVHADINISNVLVSEKETYLINFEKSVFSLSALDMYYLLQHYHEVPGMRAIILDYVKNEKNKILKEYFFFKSLLVEFFELDESLQQHSLIDIGVLNEMIAPHVLAFQVYNELNTPTTTTQASPQGSST